jgi:hypothetical protein
MRLVAWARDSVAAFRSAAERYVAVVDAAGGGSAADLLADIVGVLPALYEAALRLPEPMVETAELPETRLTHEHWLEVFNRLQGVLGKDDVYWTVDPFGPEEQEELVGSLADDLADIYRDVKEGLELAAMGASEHEVLWQWRFNFWVHWGVHLVDALRISHAHLAEAGGPRYDQREQ